VRTNFRMPDVLAIGLGGGSLVRDGGARIGPDSVGYEITSRALVFGGDTLTTTDIVVAAGLEDIGDRDLDPADIADLRDILYGLHAILRLHTVQEDETYLSLADTAAGDQAEPRLRSG